MSSEKYQFNNSVGSLDSFEVNMKQIEQTNKLLAGIETKLTDFFKKNDGKNTTHSVTFEQANTEPLEGIEDDFKGRFIAEREENSAEIGGTTMSPLHEKEDFRRFLSLESRDQSRPSRFINVIDNSRPQETSNSFGYDRMGERERFSSNLLRDHHAVPHRPSSLNNRSPSSPYRVNLQDTNLLSTKNYLSEREKFDRVEDTLLGTNPYRSNETPTGGNVVDKMNKLEEYYQNKIRLLEDRLGTSEKESQTLLKLNESLNIEITRLKKEVGESKTKFVEDIHRSLREQEERLRREYETSFRTKERAYEENSRNHERLLETIDDLKNDRLRYDDEITHLKNIHQMVLDEKDQLHRQYQSLLNIHNQMLQLDIQKNEKNLKESINLDMRPSAYRQQQMQQENESIRMLVDTLGSYKKELEYLKENNTLIQKQFGFEIQRLKDELSSQRDENQRLNGRLSRTKSPTERDRTPLAQRSPEHPSPMVKRTDVSHFSTADPLRDEDLYGLERGELTNYARKIRDSYIDLQERHKQQLIYNRALQLNLKDLGQQSKEDCERLNDAYSQVYEATDMLAKGLNSTHPTNTMNTYDSAEMQRGFPFTNTQIKTSISTKDKRERLRETLDREFNETPLDSERDYEEKRKPATRSARKEVPVKEKKVDKVDKENVDRKQLHSKQKSFEDFGDELKNLKKIVHSKMHEKKPAAGSKTSTKTPRSNNTNSTTMKTESTTRLSSKGSTKGRSRSKSVSKK